jgi:hypothetical protein
MAEKNGSGGAVFMMTHWTSRTDRTNRNGVMAFSGRGLILLIGLVLLVSCGTTTICKGCVKTVLPGHVVYRYRLFNGRLTRRVNADAGAILTVDYGASVEEGTLDMRILNPGGELVWEETFDPGEDVDSSVQVEMGQEGRYELIVEGHQSRGRFEIDWEVN